jgi:ubiquinone/menaquinone biosynthesis C-methylase UbiE/uncharacterized protein YbaR (Trm112 family)
MKRSALDTFVCPLSKGRLSLIAFEEQPVELTPADHERCDELGINPADVTSAVKDGVLYCEESRTWYPIVNFVPLLLEWPTEIHHEFRSQYAGRTEVLKTYSLPTGTPRPGEQVVQRSFTKQWRTLPLGKLSFGLDANQRDEFIRLELGWPRGERRPGKHILEVGCGSGFESMSLERVTGGHITGFDLNLALLHNGPSLAAKPLINLATASLYALPVRPRSFDIVYSSGVLHHTYSTKAGFDAIFEHMKPDGCIYIWVYAREDYCDGNRNRLRWVLEDTFRPRLARLPGFLQNPIIKVMAWKHYRMYKRLGGYNKELWSFVDSEHFIRDLWTPLYAHRHSFKEVMMWFQEKDLDFTLLDPKAYFERLHFPLIGIGIRGVPRQPSLPRHAGKWTTGKARVPGFSRGAIAAAQALSPPTAPPPGRQE